MVKGCYSSPVTLILPDFSVLGVSLAGLALEVGSGFPIFNSVLLEASAAGSVGTGGALGAEGAGKSPDSLSAGFLEVTVVPSLAESRLLFASLAAGRSDGELIVEVAGALRD